MGLRLKQHWYDQMTKLACVLIIFWVKNGVLPEKGIAHHQPLIQYSSGRDKRMSVSSRPA